MLTPKNNLKQKLSAAMDKMREKKVARLENKVEKVKGKMQPKPMFNELNKRMKDMVNKGPKPLDAKNGNSGTQLKGGNDSRQRAMDMYKSSKNK